MQGETDSDNAKVAAMTSPSCRSFGCEVNGDGIMGGVPKKPDDELPVETNPKLRRKIFFTGSKAFFTGNTLIFLSLTTFTFSHVIWVQGANGSSFRTIAVILDFLGIGGFLVGCFFALLSSFRLHLRSTSFRVGESRRDDK